MDQKGLTITQVVKDIQEQYGYKTNRHAINKFSRGDYSKVNLIYLCMYAMYFREPIEKLLSEDYSKRSEM